MVTRGARLAGVAILTVAVVCVVGCGEAPTPLDSHDLIKPGFRVESSTEGGAVLHIAVAAMISPDATRAYYGDLLRLIGERLGRRVVFMQRRTCREINLMLTRKEVDLAFTCSGPYVYGKKLWGFEILAVPVVHGKKVYRSYIITRTGEQADSLQDLRGTCFAFSNPDSNTGYLTPAYMLAQRDETPGTFFSDTFFSGSHEASIRAVADGLARGAAVDSLVWEFLKRVEPGLIGRVRVIEKSPPFGIPPVIVDSDMNAALKAQLREVFFSLHKDEVGAALLEQLQIDRFEAGDDGAYDSIRVMMNKVR